ncbi:hypothetical protein [Xenorhabdus bovienii]|uniref:Uncharacterized protein n=1 Tax=Xenorhabdus bovienii TaxID=40576 RepID=A0A0B6XBK5_XENBV|nr:hypothetical protein [Xenorhabdus bovienii]CDM89649.1 protein of unknown function [Xenorhabdus bovienii]
MINVSLLVSQGAENISPFFVPIVGWFVDFSTQLCMKSVTIPANFTSRSICDKTHLLM